MSKWVIGKYIRLSLADQDLMKKEGKTESESVTHQKALIQNFIDSRTELKCCEQQEFFDDGFSGTNFARPSFEKLIAKIKNGEINCVIVKDFSRFGRDYIELGDYLERIFPFLGVRFISINDHYDSLDYKGTTGGLDVVMKNIVYDYYSKDLSVKMKSSKYQKMKRGEYIGGHVPYGLMKRPDDHHKLMPDPEAAAIVREIFDMALDGMRPTQIARVLNERKVETPSEYYRRKHPKSTKFANTSKMNCWNHNTLTKILQQEMHYGAVVGHKRQGISVGSKQTKAVPKEERIIVEGMHEGIVTKEEFLEVQKIFTKHRDAKDIIDKNYPLHRKVKCGTCGRAMTMKHYTFRGREYRYISCPHAKSQIGNGCNGKYHKEEDLNAIVWEAVKKLFDLVEDRERKIVQIKADNKTNAVELEKALGTLQRKKDRVDNERMKNMELFMMGELDKGVYQSKRMVLQQEVEQLDGEIADKEKKLEELRNAADADVEAGIRKIKAFKGAEELDQKMVQALIDKVVVYDLEHVEIVWKFKDLLFAYMK